MVAGFSRHLSPWRLWMLIAYLGLALATSGLYLQVDQQRRADCHERNNLREPVRAALAFAVNLSQTTAATPDQRRIAAERAQEMRTFYGTALRHHDC